MLPPPYNRALVMWPHAVHMTILKALESENADGLLYEARFKSLIKEGSCVKGLETEINGRHVRIEAKLVVGADGPFSQVRESMAIPAHLHRYQEGYLVAMLECPDQLEESQYFVGKRTILGMFPAAGNTVYVFYLIPSDALAQIKADGLQALREKWIRICPEFKKNYSGRYVVGIKPPLWVQGGFGRRRG